jgi:hypothetical protein
MSRYSDRLQASTYAEDEPYGIALAAPDETPDWDGDAPDDVIWLPERVVRRLAAVGDAYELHILPLLAGSAVVRLNHLQAATLLDEIVFLVAVMNDPVVGGACHQLSNVAQRCATSSGRFDLVVEAP